MTIGTAHTAHDVRRCYAVMQQLRPHLGEDEFVERTMRQIAEGGYLIAYVEEDGAIRAVAGYRFTENLVNGRFMYVDDLVADTEHRSKGHGGALFDWLVAEARSRGCVALTLDSGVQRFDAHRFYLTKRMRIAAHHFTMRLDESV